MGKIRTFIKKVYTQGRNETFLKEDAWTPILLSDPFSIPLSRFLSRFDKINPNYITLFTVPFALAATYMFFTGNLIYGALFFLINFILDGTDGKVARLTGKTSPFGEKLDYYTDTLNNLAMYFGIWYSQYYFLGDWLVGGALIFVHYLVMVFGYIFIGDFRYKTKIPRVFSYYSPFEESFGTFFFSPLLNAVRLLFPIFIILQVISYIILFFKKRKNFSRKELTKRIQKMLKIEK